jgi:hypothetical protein
MLVLNISVGLLLFVAYQVTDRYIDSARPSSAAPGLGCLTDLGKSGPASKL